MTGPVRTCVGCRGREPKSALLRLVRDGDAVIADPGQRRPGRGAYLHRSPDCLRLALRKRSLGRALRIGGVPVMLEAAAIGLPDAR